MSFCENFLSLSFHDYNHCLDVQKSQIGHSNFFNENIKYCSSSVCVTPNSVFILLPICRIFYLFIRCNANCLVFNIPRNLIRFIPIFRKWFCSKCYQNSCTYINYICSKCEGNFKIWPGKTFPKYSDLKLKRMNMYMN